jgi:hypothetical protein
MFDIVTPRDFYAMVVQDFEDFMDEPHSARRAMHCAISAYHLHDWVWAGGLAKNDALREELGIARNKGEFVAWCTRMTWHFAIVQDLANGSKHLRPTSGVEAVKVGAPPFMWDTLTAGWGEGHWDGPTKFVKAEGPWGPKGQGYLMIDLGPGDEVHRYQPAAHVLEAVVRFWRNYLRRYDAANGPVLNSPHHPDYDP